MNLTGQPIYQKTPNLRHTAEERRYYAWLHDDARCCLTMRPDGVEIAHTGPKAMALKAPLWTCLPLQRVLHRYEERHREEFWTDAGFPDHLAWAERLWDMFQTGQHKEVVLTDMASVANREYLTEILKGTLK